MQRITIPRNTKIYMPWDLCSQVEAGDRPSVLMGRGESKELVKTRRKRIWCAELFIRDVPPVGGGRSLISHFEAWPSQRWRRIGIVARP